MDRSAHLVDDMDFTGDVDVGRCLGYQPSRFVAGPLHLDELVLGERDAPLVVEGDLVIERDLVLEHLAGAVLVLGDLRAANVFTSARLFVSGSMRARIVLANGLGETVVDGELEAGLLIGIDENLVTVFGALKADVVIDIPGGSIEGRYRKKHGAEALAADITSLATKDVRARLAAGKALLA